MSEPSLLKFLERNFDRDNNTTRHIVNYVVDLAKKESAQFIYAHMHTALLIPDHAKLLEFAFKKRLQGVAIELGVFEGVSINRLAAWSPNETIHGFDAFLGLKEDWVGHFHAAGYFDRGGNPPDIAANIQLHIGWVQDTLPKFVNTLSERISFVHFDLDTYESTRDALAIITPYLSDSVIFVLDDFHSFPGWLYGEKRALDEWLSSGEFLVTYLGFAWEQAAVRVERAR